MVAIVLKQSAELLFYLDGTRRDPPKLTIGVPMSSSLYHRKHSTVYIGYYKVRFVPLTELLEGLFEELVVPSYKAHR